MILCYILTFSSIYLIQVSILLTAGHTGEAMTKFRGHGPLKTGLSLSADNHRAAVASGNWLLLAKPPKSAMARSKILSRRETLQYCA